jgi:hypothetical protein
VALPVQISRPKASDPSAPEMAKRRPFRRFKTSLKAIRAAVMMYFWLTLPMRNVADLLHERGID